MPCLPGSGQLWAQQAGHGLCMTCRDTCLGIFSTLDSISPTRDWFKSCLERPVLGLQEVCSQQHVPKHRVVSGWQVRASWCVRAQHLGPAPWLGAGGGGQREGGQVDE